MGDKLFESGTSRSLFVVEVLLGGKREQGKIMLVMFTVVLYNAEREAQVTARYYYDLTTLKVLCHDLWEARRADFKESKGTGGKPQRHITISPAEAGGYRVKIDHTGGGILAACTLKRPQRIHLCSRVQPTTWADPHSATG